MRDLFKSTRQRNYDYLFVNIPVYDGASKDEIEAWLDQVEIACQIAGREQDIKKVALGKSKGAALDTSRSLDNAAPWGIVKDELLRCFSVDKTRVHSATLLNEIRKQETGESIQVYIHEFSKKHYQATKRLAFKDFELTTTGNFLSKLQNPRIANKVVQSKEFQNFLYNIALRKPWNWKELIKFQKVLIWLGLRMCYTYIMMKMMMKYVK